MTWHADPTALRAYAQGTAPDTVAWSVETHVTGCDTCRAALAHHLDADDATLLATARETMALPKQPHTNRIGMRPWPAVRAGVLGPWWAWAGFAAVATGLLTAASLVPIQVAETRLTGLVLLSPALPVALAALLYAVADRDATTDSTPRGGLELVLIRTAAVLTLTLPLVAAVGWANDARTAAWLLPALGLCLISLALGTWVGVERASIAVAGIWVALCVAAMARRALPTALDSVLSTTATEPLWWLLLAASAAALLWRADRLDTAPHSRLGRLS